MVDLTEAKPISAEALHAVIFHEYRQRTSVRATVEKICESFGPGTVSKSTMERWFQAFMEGRRDFVENHLHEVGLKWRYAVWIPHQLAPIHFKLRSDACLCSLSKGICYLVTGDEMWVLYPNFSRKAQ